MSYFFKRIFSLREQPRIKLIVFDFDGTLADTRGLLLGIIKKHLMKFNISLTGSLINVFGNAPLKDYISLTGIKNDFVKSVAKSIEDDFILEYEHIKSAKNIESLKHINCLKIIVSNNSTEFIEKVLNHWKIKFFDEVYGADHFTNKIVAIKRLAKKNKVSMDEIVYVGDKDKDVSVARESECYSVIISNKIAWSSRKDVEKMKPDFLIKDLSGLIKVIQHINMSEISSI